MDNTHVFPELGRPGMRRAGIVGCAAALLLVHCALLFWSATTNSVTCDEYANVPAGLAHWKTGDMSIYCLSPPLVRMWLALPLLPRTRLLSNEMTLDQAREGARAASARGEVVIPPVEPFADVPLDAKHWNYGGYFQDFNASHYQELFVTARLMAILLSCLAGLIVFLWAWEMWGPAGGLLSCGLYCLCPNIAALGSVATTEMGSATAILASLWLWQRFCRNPAFARGVLVAVAVAIAHLCKFTAIFLWPMMIAATLLERRNRVSRRAFLGGLAGTGLATLLIINVAYRFHGFGAPIASYSLRSHSLSWLGSIAEGVPLPVPRDYVVGFDAQKAELEQGSPCYLLDEIYTGSRWYYYPVIFACKLPLAIWAALAWAIWEYWRRRAAGQTGRGRFLLVSIAVILLGMGLLADINMGLRYVLPVLPLLYVFAGAAVEKISRRRSIAAAIVLCALLVENLSAGPHFLTFENVAVGGPANGWRIASETYDWGQGLIDLKKWMGDHDVPAVSLAYFGRVDPTVYDIRYRLLPDKAVLDHVVVSTYFLDGLWYMLPTPQGPTARFRIPFYAELREAHPLAVVGSTLFIYSRKEFLEARQRYEKAHGRAAEYYF